jgi:subtilisin family serine protease
MRRGALVRAVGGAALAAALVTPLATSTTSAASPGPDADGDTHLYLVALRAPGTSGYGGSLTTGEYRAAVRDQQDRLLAPLGSEPVYRWTTALNGFAVRLTADQAADLAAAPQVRQVERDVVRTVTGATAPAGPAAAPGSGHGGRGTVIGFVDTGVHPDSPVFGYRTTLGPDPRRFRGTCEVTGRWDAHDCTDKIVGARYFVEGFGSDRLRAGADLSSYDDDGHGTEVASLAAGNAGITAVDGDQDHGTFHGTAPDARIAVYKACWAAPEPADDGCSSADVVSAVDAAVADRVDVLSLAVAGSPTLDTVDLALLGAAEADVFVAAAAGNDQPAAGHAQPWVTTVGATSGPQRLGDLTLSDGSTVSGVMTASRGVPSARIVDARDIPAPGRTATESRWCAPGTLDAARAAGRIVVCERGKVGRVDKSGAVRLADGVGMVLVNRSGSRLYADFHAVPTLHVTAAEGRELRTALRAPGPLTGSLARTTSPPSRPRMLPASAAGSPEAGTVKPDLVAAGSDLLAATSPSGGSARWALASGTSVATARVSGLAAVLRSAHPTWPAARVRSALMTSGTSVAREPGSLHQGAGLPHPGVALRPGLVYDVPRSAWRTALLTGRFDRLNLPSVLVTGRAPVTVQRRVTNVGSRSMYYSAARWGFTSHRVEVTPAALRIAPGESRTVRIRVTARPGGPARADSGWVTWRGANGTRVRIPVVVSP